MCSKIQKKTSREVARMVSKKILPKTSFSPKWNEAHIFGISRSLRSSHLKKLSWGIQLSSPFLPNFTVTLKRPKKERGPFFPQRGPRASRPLSNLWLSDLPTESIRDVFLILKPLKEVDFGRFYRFQIGTRKGFQVNTLGAEPETGVPKMEQFHALEDAWQKPPSKKNAAIWLWLKNDWHQNWWLES